MNEGTSTWALVVGIDQYDAANLRDLKGAAADAVAAVGWLRKLGVPDDHIFLHASPSTASVEPLKTLGIPYGDARNPTIWSSVAKLRKVTGGKRLFVFLCGHGLYEPSTKRLFLTQEAGVDGVYSNMGIDLYANLFLSLGFRRQFLIMDGCLNLPYSAAQRQTIVAAMRDGINPNSFTPRPENSMLACFGAAQGQRVVEIEGRGAFMRRLLPAMDPVKPNPDAVTLDWEVGQLELDMQEVMQIVGRQVEKDAGALKPAIQQTPQAIPLGRQRTDGRSPVFTTGSDPPVTLELRIEPVAAARDLDTVRVWVDKRPFWQYYQPSDGATEVAPPLRCKVPSALELRVECAVRDGAPWQNVTTTTRLRPTADQAVVFELAKSGPAPGGGAVRPPPLPTTLPLQPRRIDRSADEGDMAFVQSVLPPQMSTSIILRPGTQPLPGGPFFEIGRATAYGGGGGSAPASQDGVIGGHVGAPNPPTLSAEAHYKVKLVHAIGMGWGGLTGSYPAIEDQLGLDLPVEMPFITGSQSPWLRVRPGMLIQRHEDGPEFRIAQSSTTAARRLVRRWAAAIRDVVPRDVTVHTIVEDPGPPPPNLRLVFTSTAEELAGVLAGRPTVRIGRPIPLPVPVWRSGAGRSLRDLQAEPAIRVEPGPIEVSIDLPWGSWSRTIKAPAVKEPARVRLPRVIGNPPLRVGLHGVPLDKGWRLYGTAGSKVEGRLIPADQAETVPLKAIRRGQAQWALAVEPGHPVPDEAIVELRARSRVRMPMLSKWPLAVDWSDRGLRVEPLSAIASPEWDLLVASGRLDALAAEDGVRLTEDKWFDACLGLAGAYVVYAAGDWKYLSTVTENLRRTDRTGIDVELLTIAAARRGRTRIPKELRHELEAHAATRRVPIMRWGVPLGLELLRAANLADTPWAKDLSLIAESLSPISTWTAWTVAPAA